MPDRNPEPVKLLLIDDSDEDRLFYKRLLKDAPFDVDTAEVETADEALTYLEQHPVDCIILDYRLPDATGIDFVTSLQEYRETLNIPVIMLTGAGDESIAVSAMRHGVSDYLVKGEIDAELLVLSIRSAIKQKRVEEELRSYAQDLRIAKALLSERSKKLRELNAKLEHSEKSLSALNANKNKFFSIISHDLRNPTVAIWQFAQLLKEDFDELDREQSRMLIDRLNTSAGRLSSLLDDLLLWSRMQMDTLEYKPVRIGLAQMVYDLLVFFEEAARKKGITLQHAVDPLAVFADRNMLSFILRNLISNAIKFTRKGGDIQISSRRNGEMMEVAVKDTGIGIPAEEMEHLFRIDAQYTRVGTDKEQGTGLGLILTKEFINRHGGQLRLDSEVDVGTTVTFEIPLAD